MNVSWILWAFFWSCFDLFLYIFYTCHTSSDLFEGILISILLFSPIHGLFLGTFHLWDSPLATRERSLFSLGKQRTMYQQWLSRQYTINKPNTQAKPQQNRKLLLINNQFRHPSVFSLRRSLPLPQYDASKLYFCHYNFIHHLLFIFFIYSHHVYILFMIYMILLLFIYIFVIYYLLLFFFFFFQSQRG